MKDPGCSSRISALLFSHPGSRIKGSNMQQIPDPQHWAGNKVYLLILVSFHAHGSGSQFPIPYGTSRSPGQPNQCAGIRIHHCILAFLDRFCPCRKIAFCDSVYSGKICLSNYLIICHNLGPGSPTVAGTSGGGI
jgi:hypothetical protein